MNQVSGVLELGLLLSSLVALLVTFWSQNTGPISYVFMHGGHGDNHENGDHGSDEKKQNIQKSSPDQNDKSDKGESL